MNQRIKLILSVLAFCTGLYAEVKPAGIFGENMVLQRDIEVPVWGWGNPCDAVTVEFAGQKMAAKTDNTGKWMVRLKPMHASAKGRNMVISGPENKVTIKDVLVGEVWLCSGQSNMEMPVIDCLNPQQELAKANYPQIRHFNVARIPNTNISKDTSGQWVICSPNTVRGFTAVGYFFARDLYKALGVPVGLINSSWGGTHAETWTPQDVLRAKQINPGILAKPIEPSNVGSPGALYGGMIYPLIPYAIRGVIWYQGESNNGRYTEYAQLLSAMISAWRQRWGQGDFPFGIVQLAGFMAPQVKPDEINDWTLLCEAQADVVKSIPNTGLAVAIDIGNAADIHPKNKQDVGYRLAQWALATVYGKDIEYSGPTFKSMKVESAKVRISYDHIGGGLFAKGEAPTGFVIAGKNGIFDWAEAKIDGNTVLVWSKNVSDPVSVRYGMASNPPVNLYNKANLPAVPFRTDR